MTFRKTRDALSEYSAGEALRSAAWAAVCSSEDVAECQFRDLRALTLVREAFAADTAHINPLDRAMNADIAFMKQCARREAEGL